MTFAELILRLAKWRKGEFDVKWNIIVLLWLNIYIYIFFEIIFRSFQIYFAMLYFDKGLQKESFSIWADRGQINLLLEVPRIVRSAVYEIKTFPLFIYSSFINSLLCKILLSLRRPSTSDGRNIPSSRVRSRVRPRAGDIKPFAWVPYSQGGLPLGNSCFAKLISWQGALGASI